MYQMAVFHDRLNTMLSSATMLSSTILPLKAYSHVHNRRWWRNRFSHSYRAANTLLNDVKLVGVNWIWIGFASRLLYYKIIGKKLEFIVSGY